MSVSLQLWMAPHISWAERVEMDLTKRTLETMTRKRMKMSVNVCFGIKKEGLLNVTY